MIIANFTLIFNKSLNKTAPNHSKLAKVNHYLVLFNLIALRNPDLSDNTVRRGFQHIFHLHGLQNQESIAFLDALAIFYKNI